MRTVRWLCAVAVAALGASDLVLAGESTAHRAGLGYAVGAFVGPRYVVLFAGLAALLVTRGLVHGKRTAWWTALAASTTSVPGRHHLTGPVALLGIAALGAATLLLVFYRHFRVRSDPALVRRGVALLVAGEAMVLAYGTAGLYLLDEFRSPTTLAGSARAAVRLLFLLPVDVTPASRHGHWFVDSIRAAALGIALLGLAWLIATAAGGPGQARQRQQVAAVLDRWAVTPLAHFHLLGDKSWLIAADGCAFIGYRVVGTTAVALGEPIGAPESVRRVVGDFAELCAANGWTPVFHQVRDAGQKTLSHHGFKTLNIGAEAIVDVGQFTLDGRAVKQIRSAVRRCERAGYRVVDLPHPVDDETLHRLREVSDAWLAAGNHRERTFSLGRFDPAHLRTTPIVAVVDAGGTIQAFANVLPAYRSVDGTFDLMRRRPDAVNGVMDLLFVALIERFRAAGHAGMSLGLAPLSGAGGNASGGTADRVIRLLYQRGTAFFNFAGLHAFKDKWGPRWEPRYLAYRSEADLPKAAIAVSRVGELPGPRATLVRRYPFTLGFAALQLWLMTVTALHPETHGYLLHRYGLQWADLVDGQLWRLLTGPLIQSRPGFVWSNVALLAVVLPLAEHRLRSAARMAAVFFGGDLVATLLVLVTARVLAGAGWAPAIAVIGHRDSGSSAGAWALATAVALTLPRGRRAVLAGVFGWLAAALAVQPDLANVQHLTTAVAVLAYHLGSRSVSGRVRAVRIATGSALARRCRIVFAALGAPNLWGESACPTSTRRRRQRI